MLLVIAKLSIALQYLAYALVVPESKELLREIFDKNYTFNVIDPPIRKRITIDANSTEELQCIHSLAVRWIPKVLGDFVLDIRTQESMDDKTTPPRYRSVLSFQDINNVTFVGKYYCYSVKVCPIISSVQLRNIESSLTQPNYLHIILSEDANNPLVIPHEPNYSVIKANQFEPVIIPCKPTSPDVKVKLSNQNGENIEENHTFEPEIGFTVSFKHVNQSGPYICEVVDRKDHFLQFHVTVAEKSLESYIPQPELTSDWNFRAYHGNNITIFCSFTKQYESLPGPGVILHESKVGRFSLEIELNGEKVMTDENRIITERQDEISDTLTVHTNLTIINVIKSRDEGDYKCVVKDRFNNSNSDIKPLIFVADADVTFDLENPIIHTKTGKTQAKFIIHYDAVTKITIQIINPKNEIVSVDNDIINREKYDVKITNDEILFIIKYPNIDDFGNFSIVATSAGRNFTTSVNLIVKDKPTVSIVDVFIMDGHPAVMKCKVKGYPAANISWGFISCNNVSHWPTCGRPSSFSLLNIYSEVNEVFNIVSDYISDSMQKAKITFIPSEPGYVICHAKNEIGNSLAAGSVIISDIAEFFTISGISNDHKIAEGDSVKIECAASLYNCTDGIFWSKDGEEILNISDDHPIRLESFTTKYSRRESIAWKSITKNDNGTYQCDVVGCDKTANTTVYSNSISITVHDPEPLEIFSNFNETTITHSIGDILNVTCTSIGLPAPTLIWYKNNDVFEIEQRTNDTGRQDITMSADNSSITFNFLNVKDSGKYRCVAMNRLESHQKEFELIVVEGSFSKGLIIAIISISTLSVVIFIIFVVKVRRDRSQIAVMKASGLANFEDGDLDHINPDLNLNEQADLLPYNRYFEFPREKLKLGKQLGAGAFGIVVEATAAGILLHEEETTVAVKMVKKQTDNNVIRALVSELKIMIRIGQHLNVVNLLGAVTKNIAKRELLVIVEYCRFGSLQDFLVKNHDNFIDQIRNDATVSHIVNQSGFSDSSKTMQEQEHSYVNIPASENRQGLKIVNNSSPDTKTICTSDLICWSFQIVRGMDYLSTKNVLHGDLAARNVLLCDNNVVKICDFGLAKNLYMDQNYIKKSETPLPFKWLALESISNQTFSVYSDVWSFGVLMWELFSLGKVPYTGMEPNEALFNRILNGYRMEQPEFATSDIYHIMLNCWYKVPETRPLFAELENQLGELLHSSVKNHYVQLNEIYLKANIAGLAEKSENYYLSKFSAPLTDAPLAASWKKSIENQISKFDNPQYFQSNLTEKRSNSDDSNDIILTQPI